MLQHVRDVLLLLVAALHLGFLVLEMFLWRHYLGRRVFGHSRELAEKTWVLAANQGLYNGFLAAGLGWAWWLGDAGRSLQLFFCACVVIAGLFGAATASRRILWVQAVPGLAAFLAALTG
jgi:putative membrane protein